MPGWSARSNVGQGEPHRLLLRGGKKDSVKSQQSCPAWCSDHCPWVGPAGKPGMVRFKNVSLKEKAHELLAQSGKQAGQGRGGGQGAGARPRGGHSWGGGGACLSRDRSLAVPGRP